eukprot:TRINITY_DN18452_c0_g1_i1.p1 TRINITY_DN18452_c0_g1~~TRINITY_DN18452_c0_g1_i1.p1  ORF type:complete len:660 (-),score=123.94 TRINITY_DN18452_c0_g1_i1:95-2074(-)
MHCLAAEEPSVSTFTLRCRSPSPGAKNSSSHVPAAAVVGRRGRRSPVHVDGQPPLAPPSPVRVTLLLWPSSTDLHTLYGLSAELNAAWCSVGAEEAFRLEDTDVIASAAIAALKPILEKWRYQERALEERCAALRANIQEGVDDLGDEFASELAETASLPLHKMVVALELLAIEIGERQGIAHQLRLQRADLLQLFGRRTTDTRSGVKELEREVGILKDEKQERLASKGRNVRRFRGIMEELSMSTSDGVDHHIMYNDEFGITDAEHTALLQRLSHWEAERVRRLAARGSAEKTRAIWEELGEMPNSSDDVVQEFLLSDDWAAAVTDETIALLDERRSIWEERSSAAVAELARLHAALRSFATSRELQEEVEQVIADNSKPHKQHREACRQKLRDLQAALLEAEKLSRDRLFYIYETAGLDMLVLEAFYASLEEAVSLELRRQLLADEVDRLERYFFSVGGILAQLEELKGLVVEGARFEAAQAAQKDRFSGNSLHFLEEEKFRKMFARRYPSLRDEMINSIEAWEVAEGACFVYRGSAVRERLVAMRDAENDLLHTPGDLGLLGMLLQMLDIKEVSVVNRRPVAPGGRPPRERVTATDRSPSVPSGGRGRSQNPPSRAVTPRRSGGVIGGGSGAVDGRGVRRSPTPPRKSLSVPGGPA